MKPLSAVVFLKLTRAECSGGAYRIGRCQSSSSVVICRRRRRRLSTLSNVMSFEATGHSSPISSVASFGWGIEIFFYFIIFFFFFFLFVFFFFFYENWLFGSVDIAM